ALGGVLSVAGVIGAWAGQLLAGIALCGLGWLVHEIGEALRPLARAGPNGGDAEGIPALARNGGLDLAFAAVLALPMTADWPTRLFVALVLIGLLRLAGLKFTQDWAEFLQDRA